MLKTLKAFLTTVLLLSSATAIYAQDNTFPPTGPAGVGVGLAAPLAPLDLFHIRGSLDPQDPPRDQLYGNPALRLTLSDNLKLVHGQLAIVGNLDPRYCRLEDQFDFVLNFTRSDEQNPGIHDMILSNHRGSTRFSLAPPQTPQIPVLFREITFGPDFRKFGDIERLTIDPMGRFGIDIPPQSSVSQPTLAKAIPQAQFQLGGGWQPYINQFKAFQNPLPGLVMYGGNRFEGLPKDETAQPPTFYPSFWRYIGFNFNTNPYHASGDQAEQRLANDLPMSRVAFGLSNYKDGLVQIEVYPISEKVTATEQRNDLGNGLFWRFTDGGLVMFADQRNRPEEKGHNGVYENLFHIDRPSYQANASPTDRGRFVHNTRVFINTDGLPVDQEYYWLAVNGPVKAQEIVVDMEDWSDFVFEPEYRLVPLKDVKSFVRLNGHLPDVPNEVEVLGNGIDLGRMNAILLQKIEELTLYAIGLDETSERLKARIEELEIYQPRSR